MSQRTPPVQHANKNETRRHNSIKEKEQKNLDYINISEITNRSFHDMNLSFKPDANDNFFLRGSLI
uniref:Uncharacterized protein n=1 Tax=Rhizophora mucronata TaxID=61149 RepID=A0A2P2NJ82_RHIMU